MYAARWLEPYELDFSAVEIEINHACNRRCSYCPNSISKRKNTGEIDPLLYERLMLELSRISFEGRISYDFYNEPLLHSDFEAVVARTRAHLPGAPIEVYTNGTLLTHARLEASRPGSDEVRGHAARKRRELLV